MEHKTGIFYGIGVGPGDPELITVKALNKIRESDILFLPAEPKEQCRAYRIAEQAYPAIREKEIVCVPFPMTRDTTKWQAAHGRIYGRIAQTLLAGKNAAFLTIGDVSLYSTFGYLAGRAAADGFRTEAVAGVPSFSAAAARLLLPLADADEPVHIFPGTEDVQAALSLPGTKIFMKAGKNLARLKEALLKTPDQYKVYAVTDCGFPGERTAEDLISLDENSGYLTVVIVKDR